MQRRDLFLSHPEVIRLTGRATRRGQQKQLQEQGIPFYLDAAGWPIVTVAAIEGRTIPNRMVQELGGPPQPMWKPGVLYGAQT